MRDGREVLWVESDQAYARSLTRFLRVHLPASVRVRIVDRADAGWTHARHADALIVDPSDEACFDLLAWWQSQSVSPAVALSSHFNAPACFRLQRLKAVIATKDGIFSEARQVARLLFGGARIERSPRGEHVAGISFAALLAQITAVGWTYSQFVDRFETHAIKTALEREGSVKAAAESLGMKRTTLMSKTLKLGLAPGDGFRGEGV